MTQKKKRDIVLWTGVEGINMFDILLKKEFLTSCLKDIGEQKIITVIEKNNLLEMINSSDVENLTVAEIIINQHLKKYTHDLKV